MSSLWLCWASGTSWTRSPTSEWLGVLDTTPAEQRKPSKENGDVPPRPPHGRDRFRDIAQATVGGWRLHEPLHDEGGLQPFKPAAHQCLANVLDPHVAHTRGRDRGRRARAALDALVPRVEMRGSLSNLRLILRAHTRCMGRSCAIPYLVSAGARGEAGYGFHSGKSALRAGITTDPGRLRRRGGADRCRGGVS